MPSPSVISARSPARVAIVRVDSTTGGELFTLLGAGATRHSPTAMSRAAAIASGAPQRGARCDVNGIMEGLRAAPPAARSACGAFTPLRGLTRRQALSTSQLSSLLAPGIHAARSCATISAFAGSVAIQRRTRAASMASLSPERKRASVMGSRSSRSAGVITTRDARVRRYPSDGGQALFVEASAALPQRPLQKVPDPRRYQSAKRSRRLARARPM